LEADVSERLPFAITDENGKFRLLSPAFGKTRLCAVKEEAGYPNTQGLLFVSGKENLQIVNLTSGAQVEDVDIILREPDGIVEGVVTDSTTGRPIPGARITLRRLDGISAFYSTSLPRDGSFQFALPPRPISIAVSAAGYQTWMYRDPQTFALGLVLENSTHRSIRVELTPKQVKPTVTVAGVSAFADNRIE